MAACEKCWADAYTKSLTTSWSQYDLYHALMIERALSGNVCGPREQAGQFWDEEMQRDIRKNIG